MSGYVLVKIETNIFCNLFILVCPWLVYNVTYMLIENYMYLFVGEQ